ncbi:MAG TPA: PKD domain-containing protein [Mycobacteriales bacterium]|nr:PKD domain-containing protein [Mycobacteriales bacterium]
MVWTWTMAPSSFRRPPVGAGADGYYPGDDVVDWLALDAYNWYGCGPGKPTAWRSLAEVVGPFRTWSLPHGKPQMLAEWGSSEDPADPQRKANWLREAMSTLAGWPEFKAASYFHTFGNCAWWVDSSPASERAFVEIAAAAAAHGRPTASLALSTEHGAAPLRVTVDGSASAGAGARSGEGIASWRLDFGDGSASASGSGTPPRGLAHTFRAGTHTVRLTVYDGTGAGATDTRTVTAAGPPTVATNATDATDTSVLLHAWVKPHGLAATVTFQWGTTSSAGQHSRRLSVPAQGWAAHLQLPLTGLPPGTRYYWRVVATSAAGTTVLGGRHVDTTGASRTSAGAVTTGSAPARVQPDEIDTNAWFRSGTGWAGATGRN